MSFAPIRLMDISLVPSVSARPKLGMRRKANATGRWFRRSSGAMGKRVWPCAIAAHANAQANMKLFYPGPELSMLREPKSAAISNHGAVW